jgi:hypothetical protein
MALRTSPSVKTAGILGSLGLLALVGYADYITGYALSLLVYYLLPILVGLRYGGTAFAFVMAILSALTSLWADAAAATAGLLVWACQNMTGEIWPSSIQALNNFSRL